MTRKITLLAIVPALALGLSACGSSDTGTSASSTTSSVAPTPSESTTTTTTEPAKPSSSSKSSMPMPSKSSATSMSPKPSASKKPPKPSASKPAATAKPVISIVDYAYKVPASVAPGARITIRNADSEAHTVTSKAGGFDVKVFPNATVTLTAPSKPGRYSFVCTFHADMASTLVVK